MKFSCAIFICPLVIASAIAMVQLTHTTFESCNPNEWLLTNMTLQQINNTKIITCNIIYKEADNRTIHEIHIVINDCKNQTTCIGEPIVWVENIDCDARNLSKSDIDICKIANELATLEQQQAWFKYRYGLMDGEMLYKLMFCINVNNIDFLWNDTDTD